VLGPLEVLDGERRVPLGSSKQRLLLATLLVHANEVVSVDRLTDILWGDDQPVDAVATLQTYVSRLRASLEPATDRRAEDRAPTLLTRPPGYLLQTREDEVDAASFERLLAEGQQLAAADEPAAAAQVLDEALARWRGHAFAEFAFDEFAQAEAARLEELRRVALNERVEANLRLGRHAELIGELEAIVAADPLRDQSRGQLMLALYRSGRQAEALRAYQDLRRDLGAELGIEPSPALRELEAAIVRQEPWLDWTPRPPSHLGGPPSPGRDERPGGPVTFLFTDLVGSTRLWEEHPEAMREALARHDAILREAIESNGGEVVKVTGDGAHAVFATAAEAVEAAVGAQLSLGSEEWHDIPSLRVRMGLNTGTAEHRDGDYFGPALNRAARLMSVAHGGQVLASLVTQELAHPHLRKGTDFLELGAHRLRDLPRPERIFQVLAPGLPDEFPPCTWADDSMTNLPRQVTSFVGRERDPETLMAVLSEVRLVTLTGVGGVGKTRLAVECAAQAPTHYRDGVWLCDLSPVSNADEVVQIVAAALRIPVRPGMTVAEGVAEFLRPKHLLLLLDNCEHVIEAASELAQLILRSCPDVRILATSREALNIDGEHLWPVQPLVVPESSDVGSIVSSAAGRLFCDRARAVRPGFEVDVSNGAVVADVCRHLDGIPLAIELAAARVVAMSPAEILGHLDERFRLLTGVRRGAATRHQTLLQTVEWSYSLLDARDRVVFQRLGVFPGGFDAAAASAVVRDEDIEPWDVVDALSDLVAKSMITVEDTGEDTTRYQMLETLRDYARERLADADPTDRWRRRHASWYADFAEEAGPGLEGPDELVWRRRIRTELDNLRAAVSWALESDEVADGEFAVRIVAAIAYEVPGDMSAGVGSWAGRAVPLAERSTPGRRAAVLAATAWNAYAHGDYDNAVKCATDAVRDGPPADCPVPNIPFACMSLVEIQGGRPGDAVRRMVHARPIVDVPGTCLRERADYHAFTAFCAVAAGEDGLAREQIEDAMCLASQSGNPSARAHALAILGHLLEHEDPHAAIAALDESAAISQSGASDFALSAALHKAAQLRARNGEIALAAGRLRDSIFHDHHRGSRPSLLVTLNVGVEVLADLGFAEPAAVLAGVVTAGPMAPLVADRLGTAEKERTQRILERVHAALGSKRYERAVDQGAAMSYDDVVAYALSELDCIASG
jgi:predicted ATPase/DNA-binding SARP family transcriptional activator/class 3 adenylate cyclase